MEIDGCLGEMLEARRLELAHQQSIAQLRAWERQLEREIEAEEFSLP